VLIALFGGEKDTHMVLDLCCGSGSATLAALSLGFHVLALDIDPDQREGFSRRVFTFATKQRQVIYDASESLKKGGDFVPVEELPFQYGKLEQLSQSYKFFALKSSKKSDLTEEVSLVLLVVVLHSCSVCY